MSRPEQHKDPGEEHLPDPGDKGTRLQSTTASAAGGSSCVGQGSGLGLALSWIQRSLVDTAINLHRDDQNWYPHMQQQGAFQSPAKTMRQLSPMSCQDGCPGKALLPVAAYYLHRDDQNWYPHMQQQGAFQSLGQEFMVSKGQDTPGQALLQS